MYNCLLCFDSKFETRLYNFTFISKIHFLYIKHFCEHFFLKIDWDPDEVFPLLPNDEAERRRGMKKLRTIVSQNYDEIDTKVLGIKIDEYEYPFENLAFEGGGNKGLAYCGAIQVDFFNILIILTSLLMASSI